jgi:ATP-binding cassette subfamily B protein RaxB
MSIIDNLSFGFGARLPIILQTEATECGLSCLAMIANFHGYRTDLSTLRQRYSISLKGSTLASLIQIANDLNLVTRPLKLDLDDLNQLTLPCILHWDFNHFVVLKEVSRKNIIIMDPAYGVRSISMSEVSKSFTGVALELWPNTNFEKKEEKQNIKLWGLIGKVHGLWRSLGQVLLLAFALEIFALISPLFMQWVVDYVILSADRNLLLTLALGFGLLMFLQQLITLLRSWVLMFIGTNLSIQGRANVFSHLIQLPVQYFEKRHLGDVISRFSSVDTIQSTLTTAFLEAILDGLMTVFTLALMFIYSPKLGFIALITMALYALVRWIWYRPLRTASEEQIIRAAKQSTHFMETMRGIKTIKLFQRQDSRRSTWLTLLVDQINADLTTQKLNIMFNFTNGLLFGIENILIIWFGTILVLDGNFSVGALMAFMAYKNQFGSRVSSLIDKYIQVKMLQLQGERLADIVLSEPENLYGNGHELNDLQLEPSIQVEGLQYKYSEHEPFVLQDINFKITAGESVVFVGPTGCGKTTLLNILLGVLPSTVGEVKIGDKSINDFGINTLRQMVGTVLQDDVLFSGSIEDNISFFDTDIDTDWVIACAKIAAVDKEIEAMPMGYKTLVGDMGTILSGGQKQRVLLARALYKKPKILFLDESTSHLDVVKENEVNNNIKKLNITRIMIAHRPETIASADRIITLFAGRIAQDINKITIENNIGDK